MSLKLPTQIKDEKYISQVLNNDNRGKRGGKFRKKYQIHIFYKVNSEFFCDRHHKRYFVYFFFHPLFLLLSFNSRQPTSHRRGSIYFIKILNSTVTLERESEESE